MNTLTTTHKTGFAPLPAGTRELSMQDAQQVSGGNSSAQADAMQSGASAVEAGMILATAAIAAMSFGP